MTSILNTPHKVHEVCGAAKANEMLEKGCHLIATHAAFSNATDAKIYYVFAEEKKPVGKDAEDDGERPDEMPIPRGRLR